MKLGISALSTKLFHEGWYISAAQLRWNKTSAFHLFLFLVPRNTVSFDAH